MELAKILLLLFICYLRESLGSSSDFDKGPTLARFRHDAETCTENDEIFLQLLKNYMAYRLPNKEGVTVKLEFWIQDIVSISGNTGDAEVDMYVSESWWDPALSYEYTNPCKSNITLPKELPLKIWKPQTAFVNSRRVTVHESPLANTFVLIYANGTVWTATRWVASVSG